MCQDLCLVLGPQNSGWHSPGLERLTVWEEDVCGHSCHVGNDITVQITAKGQIGGQNVTLCLKSLGKAGEGHRRWVSEIMG